MTPPEREALILSLKPLVTIIAKKRMNALPPNAVYGDILSAAWVGAIYAVDRFDPARHVRLEAYAKWRIQGAIGDYLRSLDPLSRDHRAEINRSGDEPPITFSIDQPVVTHSHHNEDLDSCNCIYDPRPGPESELLQRDAERSRARTLKLIFSKAQLKPRNASMLRRYIAGEKLKAIAESVGVNESRASQICAQALRKLRAAA